MTEPVAGPVNDRQIAPVASGSPDRQSWPTFPCRSEPPSWPGVTSHCLKVLRIHYLFNLHDRFCYAVLQAGV